jgi:hypothetical protein
MKKFNKGKLSGIKICCNNFVSITYICKEGRGKSILFYLWPIEHVFIIDFGDYYKCNKGIRKYINLSWNWVHAEI